LAEQPYPRKTSATREGKPQGLPDQGRTKKASARKNRPSVTSGRKGAIFGHSVTRQRRSRNSVQPLWRSDMSPSSRVVQPDALDIGVFNRQGRANRMPENKEHESKETQAIRGSSGVERQRREISVQPPMNSTTSSHHEIDPHRLHSARISDQHCQSHRNSGSKWQTTLGSTTAHNSPGLFTIESLPPPDDEGWTWTSLITCTVCHFVKT
jgi:uncharacterized protein (DUF4415 family)